MTKRILVAVALVGVAVACAVVLLLPDAFVAEPDVGVPAQRGAEHPSALAPSAAAIARKAAGMSAGPPGQQAAREECLTALATPEGSSQLMQQERRRRTDSHLKRQGDDLAQALAADLAGIGAGKRWTVTQPFTGEMSLRYATPAPSGERALSVQERRRLTDVLAAEGVEGLVTLGDASLFAARWGSTTTTGYLVLEHARGRHPGLLAIAAWLSVGQHELALALEAGISRRAFALLLREADIDPAANWRNGANLAKIAAIRNRPVILRLLTARGIDPAAPNLWGYRSVLDDMAEQERPADAEGTKALADVVRQLVAAGGRPYLPSTLSTLANWLPDAQLPSLHPDSIARLPALADAAEAIAQLDAEYAEKVAAATQLEARCNALIADPQVALANFAATDLASKLRYQDALAADQDQAWERARLAARADALSAGHDYRPARPPPGWWDAIEEISQIGSDEGWRKAVALADRLGGSTHKRLLDWALGTNAPIDVMIDLARRAESTPLSAVARRLPERHRTPMPFGDRVLHLHSGRADIVAVVEALEPFGLDVHYVDALGRNILTIIAGSIQIDDRRWGFIEYLGSRSVSAKPRAYGLDPLDTALMGLAAHPQLNPAVARLARFLIDHGAPVEESHLLLARQLATVEEAAHRHLVGAVPELAG